MSILFSGSEILEVAGIKRNGITYCTTLAKKTTVTKISSYYTYLSEKKENA